MKKKEEQKRPCEPITNNSKQGDITVVSAV